MSRENPVFFDVDGQGEAESEAVSAANVPIDPELQTIVERWPGLPDALKAGILAMVQASSATES